MCQPHYRRDLEADLRRFYHLSYQEAVALPAPEFLGLCHRLQFYGGVMSVRAEQSHKAQTRHVPAGVHVVEGDAEHIMADPLLSEVVSFSEV